jgi:metal-responsive CopG/Arc/MetJ family transcriptional regulator
MVMAERMSISLPVELRVELDRHAEAEGVSRSSLACTALREYLFVHRLERLRRELLPFAEAAGLYTDDDVFQAFS